MGRKPTDEELLDEDFKALFVALEKAAIPVRKKITQIRNRGDALASPETAPHSAEPSPPPASDK
jgi:hypothetical protein